MKTPDQKIITQERGPQLVDLFDVEMEKKIRREGQIYTRKTEPIRHAERAVENEEVITTLKDGTVESKVVTKPDDWIVTGSQGEKFVIDDRKFFALYRNHFNRGYIPIKRRIIALPNPYGEAIKILTPGSTPKDKQYQEGGKDCVLVLEIDDFNNFTNDRYLIGNEELLLSNYKKSLEQFRHLKGFDDAVESLGNPEQLEHLFDIVNFPEHYSREDFLEAIFSNYSGETYGDEHILKEYEQWGGPDDGKKIVTAYGEFRTKYPHLAQLSLDPAFINHLDDFMKMGEGFDFTNVDYKAARNLLKESLGYQDIYRGMSLSLKEVEAIRNGGVIASIGRHMKTSTIPTKEEFEAKILSVSVEDALRHHFYAGAGHSTFVSVSMKSNIAETFGNNYLKGEKKTYVVHMKVPVLELVYKEHAHKIAKDVESFVFWKINPEEILDIKEVGGI